MKKLSNIVIIKYNCVENQYEKMTKNDTFFFRIATFLLYIFSKYVLSIYIKTDTNNI